MSDRPASDAPDFADPPGGEELQWAILAFAWAFCAGGAAVAFSGLPAFLGALAAFAGFVWTARRWRLAVVDDAVAGALTRLAGDAP